MKTRTVFDISTIPNVKEIEEPENNIENVKKQEPENDDDKLNLFLAKSRKSISEKIETFKINVKFESLTELLVQLHSYRQLLVEDRYKLNSKIIGQNKTLKNSKLKAINNLKNNPVLLRQKDEKIIFIEAETSEIEYKIELLENHINFLDSTIKNIDNLIWGVKTRVEIEKIIRGIL